MSAEFFVSVHRVHAVYYISSDMLLKDSALVLNFETIVMLMQATVSE